MEEQEKTIQGEIPHKPWNVVAPQVSVNMSFPHIYITLTIHCFDLLFVCNRQYISFRN